MKFGRRAFLQFAAGAVGGTLLSPLPWKLVDDASIWSQNWSWRPSPERGPVTRKASVCTLCEGGCGIQVRLVNKNRAILVEGNPRHPVNEGGICPLGAAGLQFLYAPYRISQPMKQSKKRGDAAGFKPISWDEAVRELQKRLSNLRKAGTPHTVAALTGHGVNSMQDLWQQFFTAYGSPNLFTMPSHRDSLQGAGLLALGREVPFAFDLEHASFILSFGADLIEGWGSPGRMQALFGKWNAREAEGAAMKVVQVASRCSMTAAKADRWIPVRPGSEAALALGMAHVMVKENLYDASFMQDHVFGFEDWTDTRGKPRQGFKSFLMAADNSLDAASQRTGLEAPRIVDLAREFAAQNHAVAVWGGSGGNLPENTYHDLAFLALNVLQGNLKPGGMLSLAPPVPLGELPQIRGDATARKGLSQKSADQIGDEKPSITGRNLYAFLSQLAEAPPYPIEILMTHEANPAYGLAGRQTFKKAVERVGWMVSFSSYMDETSLLADIILPNHTALERIDDVIGLPGSPLAYYAVAAPVLPPRLSTRHTGEVLLQLARSMGGSVGEALPWKSYEEFLQERVKGLAASERGAVFEGSPSDWGKVQVGSTPSRNYTDGAGLWKKLSAGHCWYDAPWDPLQEIRNASGKIELAFQTLDSKGWAVEKDELYLPHFALQAPAGDPKEYPLLLLPYRMIYLSHGYFPNPPFMTKTVWDFVLKGNESFVELHPGTAQTYGLKEGDRVVIKTPGGEATVRVHLFPGARPEAVYMPLGLGRKGYDAYIGGKGANVNSLLDLQGDPLSGQGIAWSARAQLKRLG